MAEFLNKEEIDILLSAVSEGKLPRKKLREKTIYKKTAVPYNFKRPALLSKDQIKVLELLHEDFLRDCGMRLSNSLRTTVEIELVAVEQLTYTEFIASLYESTYLTILSSESTGGQIILDINPFLAFSIIDRILGGKGQTPQEPRELTSIERSIIDRIVELIMQSLQGAWHQVVSLNLNVRERETNPQFVQIVPGGELVVSAIFKVNMGESQGIMTVCYPFSTLKPLLPRLNPQCWISNRRKNTEKEAFELLQKKIMTTQLEVVVELGYARISILDFLQLTPGDVIKLNRSIDEDLIIKVRDLPKFLGSPGLVGRKKAVRITSFIKKDFKREE